MKTTLKRVLSLLLALVLMLSLCACTQKSQEDSDEPDNTGGFALPTKNDREKAGKRTTKHTGTAEGRNSLMWLRDRIDVPMTMFGAAYLGYADDLFEEEFEEELPAWLWENNEAMLREYPFIAEIDENHIIGGTGYLYCIVPVDENASVAINRVKWDNKTRSEKVTEVLYRSESGEPVLLLPTWTASPMRSTRKSSSPTAVGISASGIRHWTQTATLPRASQTKESTCCGTLRNTHGRAPRPTLPFGLPTVGPE